jgi:amino acid transporter
LYFICIYTTATNGMQFARQTIIAATGADVKDERVMRLIAVVITTFTCLILYFSAAIGRKLNRWLASLKLMLLFAIFVAGAVMARTSAVRDVAMSLPAPNASVAMLQVLYAFQGWENGTLVSFVGQDAF